MKSVSPFFANLTFAVLISSCFSVTSLADPNQKPQETSISVENSEAALFNFSKGSNSLPVYRILEVNRMIRVSAGQFAMETKEGWHWLRMRPYFANFFQVAVSIRFYNNFNLDIDQLTQLMNSSIEVDFFDVLDAGVAQPIRIGLNWKERRDSMSLSHWKHERPMFFLIGAKSSGKKFNKWLQSIESALTDQMNSGSMRILIHDGGSFSIE